MEITEANKDFAIEVFKTIIRRSTGTWVVGVKDLLETITGWRPAWVKLEGVKISMYAHQAQDAGDFADALRALGVYSVEAKRMDDRGEVWYEVSGSLI